MFIPANDTRTVLTTLCLFSNHYRNIPYICDDCEKVCGWLERWATVSSSESPRIMQHYAVVACICRLIELICACGTEYAYSLKQAGARTSLLAAAGSFSTLCRVRCHLTWWFQALSLQPRRIFDSLLVPSRIWTRHNPAYWHNVSHIWYSCLIFRSPCFFFATCI